MCVRYALLQSEQLWPSRVALAGPPLCTGDLEVDAVNTLATDLAQDDVRGSCSGRA